MLVPTDWLLRIHCVGVGIAPEAGGPIEAPVAGADAYSREDGGEDEQVGEGDEDDIDPEAAVEGPPEAEDASPEAVGLVVDVDEKEVFVVGEEVVVDDQQHP